LHNVILTLKSSDHSSLSGKYAVMIAILIFRRADNVNRTIVFAKAEHQATMPARVFGIVFDYLTTLYHLMYLRCGNQPLRSRHLSDSVRKEQKTLGRSLTN